MKKELNLKPLERFLNSEGRFKLQKVESKRPNSFVGVGQFEIGDFYLHEYPETDKLPAQTGVEIVGNGFNYLRTSPIVKIVDHDQNSTTFETEGGVYRLEKYE